MSRKVNILLVVIIFLLSLFIGGCFGQKKENADTKKSSAFNAADFIKDFKEKEVVNEINKSIENDDLGKAIKLGEAGMEKFPNSLSINLSTSLAYYYKQDYPNMIKVSRLAVKKFPKSGVALNQLSWALTDSGTNVQEGLKLADKSLTALAAEGINISGEYGDTFGYALLKNKRYKDAVTVLTKAVQETNSAEINAHLALAYEGIKNTKTAQNYWKQAEILTKIELKDASTPPGQKRRIEKLQKQVAEHLQSKS